MKIRSLLPIVAVLAFAAVPAASQPSLDVTFGRALAPLTSQDGGQADASAARQTTAGAVDLEHRIADERVRLFYSLDVGTYSTPGDWSYSLHTAGGTWRSAKPDSTRPTVFVGGSATWRANGSSWAAADYRGLGAFANVEWSPRQTTTLRAGYRVDARTFADSPELNQREQGIFGSALVSLPSRTTLIAEVRAGAKSYGTVGDAASAGLGSTFATSAATAGGANARGRGMGGSYRVTMVSAPAAGTARGSAPAASARLVSVMGRVAQSLADRTGVSLQYTRRLSFGGLPTAIVTTPALLFEDGIYDDPFASHAHAVRATLKQVWAGGTRLEGAGTWLRKEYRATPALALDGTVNAAAGARADRIWRTGAAWTRPVLRGRTGSLGIDLVVDYWYTEHRSNDAFYNYTSHSLGLGVSVSY